MSRDELTIVISIIIAVVAGFLFFRRFYLQSKTSAQILKKLNSNTHKDSLLVIDEFIRENKLYCSSRYKLTNYEPGVEELVTVSLENEYFKFVLKDGKFFERKI